MLFLQLGSLGEVPCCPTLAFLITKQYRLVSLLCLTVSLHSYGLSLWLSDGKHLSSKENEFVVFLCLRDFFTPELLNLKNTA